MIEQLKANPEIEQFLQIDNYYNTFALIGLTNEASVYYVYRNDNGEINAVLSATFPHVQFFASCKLPSPINYEFIELFKLLKDQQYLTGVCSRFSWKQLQTSNKSEVLKLKQASYFAAMTTFDQLVNTNLNIEVLTAKDAYEYHCALFTSFEQLPYEIEHFNSDKYCTNTQYFIRINEQIVAGGMIAPNSGENSMIIGIFTIPEYRRLGLASAIVSHLCMIIRNRNSIPVLLYSSREAALVYHKLGFKQIGKYNDYLTFNLI